LKEEALDRIKWRNRSGRGCRLTDYWWWWYWSNDGYILVETGHLFENTFGCLLAYLVCVLLFVNNGHKLPKDFTNFFASIRLFLYFMPRLRSSLCLTATKIKQKMSVSDSSSNCCWRYKNSPRTQEFR
jgi:hypothetical protein